MFVPRLVSEREAGGWEDCVWASGVMLANGLAGADVHPGTRTEYEALRVAGGDGPAENPGDGSNLSQLQAGLERRYSITAVKRGGGWHDFMTACPIGTVFVVQGLNGALPARLRGSTFTGPHAVAGVRTGSLQVALLNPLFPNGTPPAVATLDELRAFYESLPGAEWLVGTTRRTQPMAISIRRELYDVGAGTPFYDTPGGQMIGDFTRAQAGVRSIGVPMDASPDKLNLGWRALEVMTRAIDDRMADKIVYVQTAQLSNGRPDPAATADELEAAHLAGAQAEWDRWVDELGIPDRPAKEA